MSSLNASLADARLCADLHQAYRTTTMFRKLIRHERGATAIEHGLIAVAAISAMSTLGGKISTTFNNVSENLK